MVASTSIPDTPATPLPPPPAGSSRVQEQAAAELEAEKALVHVDPPRPQSLVLSPAMARLPVELDVAVPVRQFRVRNLLALELGQVIESQWPSGEDLPLATGEVQLAWVEFEVVEADLAVRLTRLI